MKLGNFILITTLVVLLLYLWIINDQIIVIN